MNQGAESKGRARTTPTSSIQFLNLPDDHAVVVGVPSFVYILRCADGSLYIGETGNLDRRAQQHQRGTACSFTSLRTPVRLVYAEAHPTPAAARRRERQLKGWTRAKKEALIAGDLALLKRLWADPPFPATSVANPMPEAAGQPAAPASAPRGCWRAPVQSVITKP